MGGTARFAAGVNQQHAQEWIDTWVAHTSEAYPRGRTQWALRLLPIAEAAISPEPLTAITDVLRLIAIATGLILLIACANLSILFLVGLASRSKELALRQAHGASRARIARQMMIEILGLGAIGIVAGLVLGGWWAQLGQRLVLPPQIAPLSLPLDRWSVGLTVVAAFVSCLIAGLPALLRLRTVHLFQVLGRAAVGLPGLSRSGDRGVVSRRNAFTWLVASQTALSLPLLYGVFLVVGSLIAQMRIDPGLKVEGVELAEISPGLTRIRPAEGRDFYRQLCQRLDDVQTIETAGLAVLAPFGDNSLIWEIRPPDGGESFEVAGNIVSPGYFNTLGVTLLGGRDFDFERDGPEQEPAVIVNASLARRLWPIQQAVGRSLDFVGFDGPESYRVVGVVADTSHRVLQAPVAPMLFRPLTQDHQSQVTLHAGTSLPAATFRDLVRESVEELNPQVPVSEFRSLAGDVVSALARPRYLTLGMGLLGAVAAMLTAIGLYGVLSFAALRQLREIGIRMSIGASRKRIHLEMLARGLRLTLLGMVPGVGLALVFGRLLSNRLYGLSSFEGLSLIAAGLLLVAVALLASEIPARRATTVDPVDILRRT